MPAKRDAPFIPRLKAKIEATGNYLCVGIDPHVEGLPPFFTAELERHGPERFLQQWGFALVDAAAGKAPAVKPQSAFFEAFGAPGFAALKAVIARANARGLITVLDAKRGDISSTMGAYGRMAFEEMDADVLTVAPYIGLDTIDPLLPWLRKGRGVYVVWVSSNPGGKLIQEMPVATGEPLYESLFHLLKRHFDEQGVSEALGLVLGTTKFQNLNPALLARLTDVSLLLPGIGAQGATVTSDLLRLMRSTVAPLAPQSRSLGQPTSDDATWEKYGANVARRIAVAAAELAL